MYMPITGGMVSRMQTQRRTLMTSWKRTDDATETPIVPKAHQVVYATEMGMHRRVHEKRKRLAA